ncbi:MAG: M48 family peptidase, partial [Flavobacteriaceae bacterium]|nr:M48 family peptidase [Flavobacteriaceae bacterium]
MRGGKLKIRLLIGLAIIVFAFIRKCNNKEVNPYTGKEQSISISTDQEIQLGLQSFDQMTAQYG